jgi:hypothetical protein
MLCLNQSDDSDQASGKGSQSIMRFDLCQTEMSLCLGFIGPATEASWPIGDLQNTFDTDPSHYDMLHIRHMKIEPGWSDVGIIDAY